MNYAGGDTDIERSARMSYGQGTRAVSDTRALLRYLMRHRHDSPFESAWLQFHVKVPKFIAVQFMRHRLFSFNEVSGRYSEMPTKFYRPTPATFGMQATNNKQGRIVGTLATLYDKAKRIWQNTGDLASASYDALLEMGVARELARIDLPQSMMTEFTAAANLRTVLHFLTLRTDAHAQ